LQNVLHISSRRLTVSETIGELIDCARKSRLE
jgi:hypothetical protein